MKDDKSIGEKMLKKRMQSKREENETETGKREIIAPEIINTNTQATNDMNMYRQRRLDLADTDILNTDRSTSYQNIPILTNNGSTLDKKMI